MKSVQAIFTKQALDMFKNKEVLIQFIIFPLVAFVMTELVAKKNADIPDNMFVLMMSSIFTGMALVTTLSSIIAEDKERKSLRFLVIAGVKPYEYLLGIGGVVFIASTLVSLTFGLMGNFSPENFGKFIVVMMIGAVASILLGSTIGIISKNQQAAVGLAIPLAMILGFSPMISMFNETAKKIFGVLYTQQLNVVVNDFSAALTKPLLMMLANIVILVILFVVAYTKKGLRD